MRHIQNNSGIFNTLFFQVYAGIFNHIQRYKVIFTHIETLLRHIQASSGIFSTLCNPRIFTNLPYLSPGIFKTGGFFKTLWNVDQTYSEPCHRILFSQIQKYSGLCAMPAYVETWHILENLRIFRTLTYLKPDTTQNPLKGLRWSFLQK